jgi:hypothetical protein
MTEAGGRAESRPLADGVAAHVRARGGADVPGLGQRPDGHSRHEPVDAVRCVAANTTAPRRRRACSETRCAPS